MKYRVAETDDEYAEARRLMLAEGFPDQGLVFPTILAVEDDEIIGFIATAPRTDMVLSGPMVMRQDKRRVFTAVRLVTLYESVMKKLGMTVLTFYADEKDSIFVKAVRKWFPQVQPYAKQGTTLFYKWHLSADQRKAS